MAKQKKYIPPWNKGDLITGIDRSYPRSIYRYHGLNKWGTEVIFEFLAIDGRSYAHIKGHLRYFPAILAKDYRIATKADMLEAGYITQSIDFIL